MSNQDIFALIDRFDTSKATSLKLTCADFTLELNQGGGAIPVASSAPTMPQMEAAPTMPRPQAQPVGEVLTSPLVGTYYAAASPDAAPFVKVGDTVEAGQVLCLVEAMKMMNEIKAPCACVVKELLCENGALVGFGDSILRYSPV